MRALDLVEPVERRAPPAHARRPPHDHRRAVQHLRLRALRADARRPRACATWPRRRPTISSRSSSTRSSTAAAGSSTIRPRRASTRAFAEYVFVHEFGHHFAALADEYYTSPVSYATTGGGEHPEPWEPNVTARTARIRSGRPSTRTCRCRRRGTRRRSRNTAARSEGAAPPARDERAGVARWTSSSPRSAPGRRSSSAGRSTPARSARSKAPRTKRSGLYRPEVDCIMFTRDEVGFCRVCRKAIERIIDEYK